MQTVVFFGSDQYSAIVLNSLTSSSALRVALVITDRSKPKDREQKIEPNPVEKIANSRNIKICYYPEKNEDSSILVENIRNANLEIGVAASFDHLLPSSIIAVLLKGILNVHPSLLPQYRNVSPVQYAIAMGDQRTGVSIFKISEGIDNGEIVAQATESINKTDTSPSLSERLFLKGADILISHIIGKSISRPLLLQPLASQKLIFTRRLTRESGYVEWEVIERLLKHEKIDPTTTKNSLLSLRLIHNPEGNILNDLTRALSPWPGVWTTVTSQKGELRISFTQIEPQIMIKIAGKPKAISWSDFSNYYL